MSNETINPPTIRARMTGVTLNPENKEYGDEHKAEYALLNGCDPGDRSMRIPEASATLRIRFPAGVDFLRMAQVMERLEQVVRAECAVLAEAHQ